VRRDAKLKRSSLCRLPRYADLLAEAHACVADRPGCCPHN
jgi:hypothetical protein